MTMGKTPNGRLSHPHIEGVNAFINSARAVVDLSGNIILHLKLIVLYYTKKFIFAFYNLYIRCCDFNLLVWLLLIHYQKYFV